MIRHELNSPDNELFLADLSIVVRINKAEYTVDVRLLLVWLIHPLKYLPELIFVNGIRFVNIKLTVEVFENISNTLLRRFW